MKKILIVDDNRLNLIAAKNVLNDVYSVSSVLNGEEALEYLERESCDLILLDINMPDMDGWLGGSLHYVDSEGQMMLCADVRVDDFVYEKSPMGNWEMSGVYLPGDSSRHHVDGFLTHNDREIIYMNGIYQADAIGNENITGNLELQHFPLTVLNPFIPEKMVEFTGDVDGTLSMDGNPMHPNLNGGLKLDSVSMTMPDLSIGFRFDDKMVNMVDSKMMFEQFNIYTKGDTVFIFNFHPTKSFEGYFVPVGEKGTYQVVLTTDSSTFGGFSRVDTSAEYQAETTPADWIGFPCYLPNRCAIVLKKKE